MAAGGHGSGDANVTLRSLNATMNARLVATPSSGSREQRGTTTAVQYQQESVDDSFLKSLKLLQRYQKTQLMKQRGLSKKGTSKATATHQPFQFTPNMFFRSNTEALIQVTYQVLATVFPDESEVRFRTCWPTEFDRKLESEYRKVAFIWVLELFEQYPEFFDGKPVFSYFVSPFGSKCVRFLAGLAECGLCILAMRIQEKRGEPFIDVNPKNFEDLKEAEENFNQLKLGTEKIDAKCKKLLKNTLQLDIYKEQLSKMQEQQKVTNSKYLEGQESKMLEYIDQYPELFPENAQSLLHSLSRFLLSDGRDFDPKMLVVGSNTIVEDKLATRVTEELKRKLTLVRETYEAIRVFLTEQKILVDLLDKIGDNLHIAIDSKNYPETFKPNGTVLPDYEEFLLQIQVLFESIQKIFPADEALIRSKPRLLDLVKQITDNKDKLNAVTTTTLDTFQLKEKMEDLRFSLRVVQMELEGTDWNKYLPETSTKNTMDVNRALTLTPAKPLDFSKSTGLTPNFDCGIQMSSTPESKIDRLMNSIRISVTASGNGVEHDRVVSLRNGDGVRRNLAGKVETLGLREGEEPLLDLDLSGLPNEEDARVVHTPKMLRTNDGSDTEFERGILDDTSFIQFYKSPDSLPKI